MTDDPLDYFRRRHRREYLRRHEQLRRADLKAEGARRIDVTLRGDMLDNYATVRQYLEGLNRHGTKHKMLGFPIRLSDTEVIRMALSRAADAIFEEDTRAAKAGQLRILAAE